MHLAISGGLEVVRLIVVSSLGFPYREILAVCVSATLFGFFERIMKEDWVLLDSFRRAQHLYMQLVDKLPAPNFVTDGSGRIVHMNSAARALFSRFQLVRPTAATGDRGFLDMVHPRHRTLVEFALKDSISGQDRGPANVPVLVNKSESRFESSCELGLDIGLLNQGTVLVCLACAIGYEYFMLRFERLAWKSANCVVVSCERDMDRKLLCDNLLRSSLQLRDKLHSLCCTAATYTEFS